MFRKVILNVTSVVNHLMGRKVSIKKYLISKPPLSDRTNIANDFNRVNCDFVKSNHDFMVGLHKFKK